MKEAAELTASPSPHFHAHPVSDTNLYDWHFTIAGPPAPSPYASGIYHGRIVLPPTYPLRPPSFRFLTPSGRFEVNREICLSISGHHEETWQPAWGIRTALLAIRSFMEGDAKGQVGGLDVSESVRREHAERSRGWSCDLCGRSNEAILGEWRDYCRENGVDVGDGDNERVVISEKLGEGEKEVEGDEVANRQDGEAAISEKEIQDDSTAPLTTVSPEVTQEQPQITPVTSPVADSQTPATAVLPRPAVNQHPAQAVASQQSEDPWLDRAIIGVLIALVIMILRRIASSEE
jgi:ubiquitin-conjugating enzyme E2 J1